ncbi:MAG: ABC transporter ATP-binding protein [bacterium]|uniref:Macrolide ABC transporter ATP-binding protein n=2 Tax=Candidatus Infernicultor aquiphilus TaxID=1805029 RepID=A0A1J5GPJ4_9BACT|nr:ABC transporter ATP-binding protein [bacterium]OIP74721.1 MAG: macrolide ABC transporter ATP-binding protein [Candidatus Atribacteria bacterium CG2_30_33_13]PIW12578.1 MAG: macrolide ABC transporter ATP-binding protein [Candidatus Atribacteria bacterium CG17_big_fil_post_rev_8_21_14_2_50_34_11]
MLEIKKITKVYKMGEVLVNALRGVSFHINKGQFVAIMGPSGSGKSTLMHIIGCLDHPTEGIFIMDGEDISKVNDNKLAEIRNKKIGFVFQQFNLLARTTILYNVEVPLIYAGVNSKKRKKLAEQALENVGLSNRLKHRPNEISGGEIQRAAIARALVNNPLIILADEPTGNLDSKNGEEIMKIFNKLHQEGHTIIMVTHELEVAKYAQRIIHLHDGLIEKDEVIENVF